jgi:hypothetical protein
MYKEVSKSKVTNTLDALKFILTCMYTWHMSNLHVVTIDI